MAVPTSGILHLEKMAREAKYADYNGSQAMGEIAIYDIVNGGNTHGSTLSYPVLNTSCLPNPTGSLTNPNFNPCEDGLDVCYIIDYTGSMGGEITNVKNGLTSVIAHLNTESNSDYRVSLVTVDEESSATPNYGSCSQYTSLPTAQKYNNQGSSGKYQIITAWEMFPTSSNNNGTAFSTAVNNLNGGVSGSSCIQLGDGRGVAEPTDLALNLVINTTNFVNNFRDAAAKYIILITDAPPSGGDDAFTIADFNALQISTATCVFRGIKVFVLGDGINSNITVNGVVRYPWREIATTTGGTYNISYDTTDVEIDITVACDNAGTYLPYKFSAWYGYDQDCTTGITPYSSASVQANDVAACSATINQTYYHNGSASLPAVGDRCFIDQNQTIILANGYYLLNSTSPNAGGVRITNSAGDVASVFSCGACIGFLTNTAIRRDACVMSSSNATWYHNNASGSYPSVGDIVYDDTACTSPVSGGSRRWFFANGTGGGTYTVQLANVGSPNTGLVTAVGICF